MAEIAEEETRTMSILSLPSNEQVNSRPCRTEENSQ